MPAAHPAVRRVHDDPGPLFVAKRPSVLVDHGAGRLGGTRHSLSEFQRVQMPAARIQQAAEIARAPHVGLQLPPVEQVHRAITVLAAKLLEPLAELDEMPRLGRDVHVVGTVVALDAVLSDERLIEIEGLHRHLEQPFRILASDLGAERLLAGRESEDRLAAAAPRRAVADEIRLEHGDPEPALRQMQRRGAPGEPAADDGDVRLELARERRPRALEARRTRGVVIGGSRREIQAQGEGSGVRTV